mgnify:CR=1 FL=1
MQKRSKNIPKCTKRLRKHTQTSETSVKTLKNLPAAISAAANLGRRLRCHCRRCRLGSRCFVWGAGADAATLEDVPFLPVRLFKSHLLASVPPDQRFKTLTSSGTLTKTVKPFAMDPMSTYVPMKWP